MDEPFEPFTIEGLHFVGAYTKESILATKNFQGRSDDIFISTYPRSGTTWIQNILIGLVYGRQILADIENFEIQSLSPYMEIVLNGVTGCQRANLSSKSPRLLKQHLPTHLAPSEISTKKRRNVAVLRNPKDVALSYFTFYQKEPFLKKYDQNSNLQDFLDKFLSGHVNYGKWWNWTEKWIEFCMANPETNLMIHYEDLKQDFTKEIRRLESFLNLAPMTSEAIDKLKALTSVESMKERLDTEKNYKGMGVVNKGEANRWKKEFPPEYVEKFDALTRETFGDDEIVAKFI